MKLYISLLSAIVLLVFYLPLVVWILWRIIRSPTRRGANKAAVFIGTAVLAYTIPLADVTLNSIAMAKVCPKAGLHRYKEVQVEGYYDPSGDPTVLERQPYRFIEGGTRKMWRSERQSDGRITHKRLDQPSAEYEIAYEGWTFSKELGVERKRYQVRNRITGEVIGERLLFVPLAGWLDRFLVIRWFGGPLEGCDGGPGMASRFPLELLPPKLDKVRWQLKH